MPSADHGSGIDTRGGEAAIVCSIDCVQQWPKARPKA